MCTGCFLNTKKTRATCHHSLDKTTEPFLDSSAVFPAWLQFLPPRPDMETGGALGKWPGSALRVLASERKLEVSVPLRSGRKTTSPTNPRGPTKVPCPREKQRLGASARRNGSVGVGLRHRRQAGNRGDGRDGPQDGAGPHVGGKRQLRPGLGGARGGRPRGRGVGEPAGSEPRPRPRAGVHFAAFLGADASAADAR